MHSYEKQALSGAIEILSQSELPDRFEGMKLYGFSEEAKDELRQVKTVVATWLKVIYPSVLG